MVQIVSPQLILRRIRRLLRKFEKDVGKIEDTIAVNIDIEGVVRTLSLVKYTGSGNVLKDKDVVKYLRQGGTIVGIEFIGEWRNCNFKFKIGYSTRIGYCRVSRGRNSLELTEEALSKLREVYLSIYG
ncbi:MAG: hypothetical protein HXS48_20885 [Theionarchaea archaeon]|nr:hypothetical protein [Theionarchaea archaeon]